MWYLSYPLIAVQVAAVAHEPAAHAPVPASKQQSAPAAAYASSTAWSSASVVPNGVPAAAAAASPIELINATMSAVTGSPTCAPAAS